MTKYYLSPRAYRQREARKWQESLQGGPNVVEGPVQWASLSEQDNIVWLDSRMLKLLAWMLASENWQNLGGKVGGDNWGRWREGVWWWGSQGPEAEIWMVLYVDFPDDGMSWDAEEAVNQG